ncbi:U11/U12 small nuclear ribonucleoprotein 48 kDa protein [Polypterus senegalus]|uniref:U11/U12 small nuclear ribonucleoprotein 48 kDa protein n=1 Tax=Polypterus senegalus TaxID=55291 RepID=UPI0019622B74|nr:U11/U12 small nuclear ribonucleoprotein 48 kDa protein [Polypterus senegalus]
MCDTPAETCLPDKLQNRLKQLQELTEFAGSCENKLNVWFDTLGWSRHMQDTDNVLEPFVICPYNNNHRIPKSSLEKHATSCKLRMMGYSQEEEDQMYDPSFFYSKANVPSVTIDKTLQNQIILQARSNAPYEKGEIYSQSEYSASQSEVPQNHKRAICDLTAADRLSIYDHVVKEAKPEMPRAEVDPNDDLYVDLAAKLKKDEQLNEPKTRLEVLAEMRDYKRRRQSYRAKNVHITKKSYTEVIREVIDVHSEELSRLWQEDGDDTKQKSEEHGDASSGATGRSPSVDSHHSYGSSKGSGHSSHRWKRRSKDHERDSRRKRDSRSPEGRHRDRKRRK